MERRNIITIGASTGGLEAIRTLIQGLPAGFDAAILIVWHIPPDGMGILPGVLNRLNILPAAHAIDGEPLKTSRIYVAPPDHHLLITKSTIRVTKGPKENRFRPAIDPLFRSAAYAYGPRVIGIVLTGALDDGTGGLWAIKQNAGVAIVQDPNEAEHSSMPNNALRAVNVDYKVTLADMPSLLTSLVNEEAIAHQTHQENDESTKTEIQTSMADRPLNINGIKDGDLTPYTCPECHGVLAAIREGKLMRFRCHTGHAFSPDSLLAAISENIEENLWSTIRSLQESIFFLNHMGDHFAEINQPKLAAMYFNKARQAESRAEIVRQALNSHEHLSRESVEQQTPHGHTGDAAPDIMQSPH